MKGTKGVAAANSRISCSFGCTAKLYGLASGFQAYYNLLAFCYFESTELAKVLRCSPDQSAPIVHPFRPPSYLLESRKNARATEEIISLGGFDAKPIELSRATGQNLVIIITESTSNPADAGCNSDNAQYSSTPKLHHSARQDSRTTTRKRTKRLTRSAVKTERTIRPGLGDGTT